MTYTYDAAQNIVRAAADGVLTLGDIIAYCTKVLIDREIQPGFIEVASFEDVLDLKISYHELQPLQDLWQDYYAKGCAGTLILAPNDLSYGITRMCQAVILSSPGEGNVPFQVFRTREELEQEVVRMRAGLEA